MNPMTHDSSPNDVPLSLATLDDIVQEYHRRGKSVVVVVSEAPMKGKDSTSYQVQYSGKVGEITGMLAQAALRLLMIPVTEDMIRAMKR